MRSCEAGRVVTRRSGAGGQKEKGMLWFAGECVCAGSAAVEEDLTPSFVLLWCFKCRFGRSCLVGLLGEEEHKLNPCSSDFFQVL